MGCAGSVSSTAGHKSTETVGTQTTLAWCCPRQLPHQTPIANPLEFPWSHLEAVKEVDFQFVITEHGVGCHQQSGNGSTDDDANTDAPLHAIVCSDPTTQLSFVLPETHETITAFPAENHRAVREGDAGSNANTNGAKHHRLSVAELSVYFSTSTNDESAPSFAAIDTFLLPTTPGAHLRPSSEVTRATTQSRPPCYEW